MKTYAESQGAKPFDWNAVLNDAINSDPTLEEWGELTDKAAEWVTCACGNQCDIIPRDKLGEPVDNQLRVLGIHFYGAIAKCAWFSAKCILALIEERSAELIADINAKGSK